MIEKCRRILSKKRMNKLIDLAALFVTTHISISKSFADAIQLLGDNQSRIMTYHFKYPFFYGRHITYAIFLDPLLIQTVSSCRYRRMKHLPRRRESTDLTDWKLAFCISTIREDLSSDLPRSKKSPRKRAAIITGLSSQYRSGTGDSIYSSVRNRCFFLLFFLSQTKIPIISHNRATPLWMLFIWWHKSTQTSFYLSLYFTSNKDKTIPACRSVSRNGKHSILFAFCCKFGELAVSWKLTRDNLWCSCKRALRTTKLTLRCFWIFTVFTETRRFHDGSFPSLFFFPRSTESPRNGMRFRSSCSDMLFDCDVFARKLCNNIIRPCIKMMRALSFSLEEKDVNPLSTILWIPAVRQSPKLLYDPQAIQSIQKRHIRCLKVNVLSEVHWKKLKGIKNR